LCQLRIIIIIIILPSRAPQSAIYLATNSLAIIT